MNFAESRRRFFGWLALVIPGTLLASDRLQAADEAKDLAASKEPAKKKAYYGVSKKGVLQDALDDAVTKALASAPGADRLIKWSFKDATGQKGGIAGVNEITVTIEATIS
jgi:hypothetical protein